jgi:hypothetical protein
VVLGLFSIFRQGRRTVTAFGGISSSVITTSVGIDNLSLMKLVLIRFLV